MRKTNVLFLVLTISMVVFCGISYAAVAGFINAAQPAAVETDAAKTVEGAVRDEAKPPIASNTGVVTTEVKPVTSLASGETLAQARPDLAQDMSKLLTIPAQSIIIGATLDVAVTMINDAIANGKDVGIMGLNDEELVKAAAALEGKVANLADLKEKRILFLVFNATIIDAVQQQFNQSNGNYLNATANLLSPVVQDALKGGV